MEKRVGRAFEEKGAGIFMPMETVFRSHGHKTKFERPLVKGYVFVSGEPDELLALTHDIHGALAMVMENDRPAEMPDFWIDDLRKAWMAGEFDYTLPRCRKTGKIKRKLEIGDPVRVCGGLYYGAPGKLLKLLGRRRAEIEATWFYGQIVRTKIDLEHLEAA
jgi:transcription antitermination factor NusG